MKTVSLFTGAILIILSFYVALEGYTNHFYEITLLGLLFVLLPLTPQDSLTPKIIIELGLFLR